MTYFRKRNGLRSEYSGHEEASQNLRFRIGRVVDEYLASGMLGIGQERSWVHTSIFIPEIEQYLLTDDYTEIIRNETYDKVFELVEIYLAIAEKYAYERYRTQILPKMQRAFTLAGSVYLISKDGKIELREDDDTIKNIEAAQQVLEPYESAYNSFTDAVVALIKRDKPPKDITKEAFVSFESYLKEISKKKDFGEATKSLLNGGSLNKHQYNVLTKLYSYRSDAYAVGHAGKTPEPDEIDALWFLETLAVQIKLISKRSKKDD